MLPWTEIVKKETWVYNLQCSDCKHQLPTDHVEFSNKKCEVIHSNKKNISKESRWCMISKEHLILLNTHQIFHYMHKNSSLHFVNILYFSCFEFLSAFFCFYVCVLYCLISNQLKVHFFSKHWVLKMHLTMADFLFKQIQKYKDINDNLHLSLSAY